MKNPKNCFDIFQSTSVSGQWLQQIMKFFFHEWHYIFRIAIFQIFFIRQKLKSVLKFYNWPSQEEKILQKLAASREGWSLQICHCHFWHHLHKKLQIMNSVKNQWSCSLTILSKGLKWRRIWGICVTLKLSPNIVLFKSVFRNQIRNLLKEYNIKQLFCLILLIQSINL